MKKLLFTLTLLGVILLCMFSACNCGKSKTYQVTFDGNGGTLVSGEIVQKVKEGKSATAPVFYKEGYNLSFDKPFNKIKKSITVNAVWTAKEYVANIDLSGGDAIDTETFTFTYDSEYVLPTVTKDYSVFKGWELNGQPFTDGTWTNDTAETLTLTATWEALPSYFDFSLNADGESYKVFLKDGETAPTDLAIISEYKNKPVTTVGSFACEEIETVTLPQSVSIIEDLAFDCANLKTVAFDGENDYFKFENNSLMTKDGSKLLQFAYGSIETIVGTQYYMMLSASVTEIVNGACSKLPDNTKVFYEGSDTDAFANITGKGQGSGNNFNSAFYYIYAEENPYTSGGSSGDPGEIIPSGYRFWHYNGGEIKVWQDPDNPDIV